MKKRADWPHWIGGTKRQFRQRKRQELRAVIRAMNVLRLGCAYSPMYKEFERVANTLTAWQKAMSAKTWR